MLPKRPLGSLRFRTFLAICGCVVAVAIIRAVVVVVVSAGALRQRCGLRGCCYQVGLLVASTCGLCS
eukprot:13513544-Alexandrium_andersonii.AAC.1